MLTVDEAAKILRISRGLAFTAVRNGSIPHLRIGRRILIPEHALKALLGDRDTSVSGEITPVRGVQSAQADPHADDKLAALRELATTLETLIAESDAERPSRGGQ